MTISTDINANLLTDCDKSHPESGIADDEYLMNNPEIPINIKPKLLSDQYEWNIVWFNVMRISSSHLAAIYGLYLYFVEASLATLVYFGAAVLIICECFDDFFQHFNHNLLRFISISIG